MNQIIGSTTGFSYKYGNVTSLKFQSSNKKSRSLGYFFRKLHLKINQVSNYSSPYQRISTILTIQVNTGHTINSQETVLVHSNTFYLCKPNKSATSTFASFFAKKMVSCTELSCHVTSVQSQTDLATWCNETFLKSIFIGFKATKLNPALQ